MAYDLVAKELNVLLLQTETVIFLILIIFLELDDKIDFLLVLYTLYTK